VAGLSAGCRRLPETAPDVFVLSSGQTTSPECLIHQGEFWTLGNFREPPAKKPIDLPRDKAAPLQHARPPRFSLNIPSMCGKLSSPIMEVAGTVSWILAQKNSAVWTVRPDALVYDAIKMMADKNVGALPVVQNDKLVGIVSERDYTRKVILLGRSSKETRVSEIMSTNVVVTHPNESLTGCMHMMTDKRVRHLPVVEDGKLVGILSIGDALKWLISAQTATIEHLEQYISGGYPS